MSLYFCSFVCILQEKLDKDLYLLLVDYYQSVASLRRWAGSCFCARFYWMFPYAGRERTYRIEIAEILTVSDLSKNLWQDGWRTSESGAWKWRTYCVVQCCSYVICRPSTSRGPCFSISWTSYFKCCKFLFFKGTTWQGLGPWRSILGQVQQLPISRVQIWKLGRMGAIGHPKYR